MRFFLVLWRSCCSWHQPWMFNCQILLPVMWFIVCPRIHVQSSSALQKSPRWFMLVSFDHVFVYPHASSFLVLPHLPTGSHLCCRWPVSFMMTYWMTLKQGVALVHWILWWGIRYLDHLDACKGYDDHMMSEVSCNFFYVFYFHLLSPIGSVLRILDLVLATSLFCVPITWLDGLVYVFCVGIKVFELCN